MYPTYTITIWYDEDEHIWWAERTKTVNDTTTTSRLGQSDLTKLLLVVALELDD